MSVTVKRRADYLPPAFTVSSVSLEFFLHPEKTRVCSSLTVSRNGNHNKPLELDGEQLTLLSVAVDGNAVEPDHCDHSSLHLSDLPDAFTLQIETEINPSENHALEGLYLSNGVYCTQCEAEGFRRITYFLDRPDVLAEYRVTVHGEKQAFPTLLSNGNPVEKGENDDGTHWVTWHDPHPKPSYLFALVAGDFDLLTDTFTTMSGKDVALELYVDKGKKGRGEFALDSLKRAMKWDEQTFGLEYDLDIYMIVAVDFFNMGAMENKGLNIFNSKFVLADNDSATDDDFFNVESVIAHEYFHNWTGNRVTCRDWFQLSLKEGLTVFRDQQFSADMTSPLSNRIKQVRVMREHQFAEDASAMSHPIRPDEVMEMNNFYTVTVYDKGAEVIRMLHTLLGQQTFRRGIDEYFRRHDGQAVTCDDFVAAMQAVTDRDLSQFSRWYSQSGTPEITVNRQYDDATGAHTITLSQRTPATADQKDKQPLLLPVAIELIDDEGNSLADDEGLIEKGMLILDAEAVTLTVTGAKGQLTPVLLGNFSAPARVHNDLCVSEQLKVVRHAKDSFNRWDAMQSLYDFCISEIEAGRTLDDSVWRGLRTVIASEANNMELLGECLVIPTVETLCQSRNEVDVQALIAARKAFCQQFAEQLEEALLSVFDANHTDSYRYVQSDINTRRCRNVILAHLARLPDHAAKARQQYNASDNMTDTLGALKAAQYTDQSNFLLMMGDFEETWHNDPLVLDKWFALHATQARSDILAQLSMLREHPQFSANNPNRVRAVIGSFAFFNNECFHARDGSGYKYVTDYLMVLDDSNPQVAARIVTPLTQWQRYADPYRSLMKAQLSRLLTKKNLSKDLFEKVSKSLAYDNASSD
ncbi:aminopeptidase N [Alteromonas halophila]|uniref:Aminopeptidase N n=1 Tax=Alteromonas halophila TaxID=516698 RepID=A0A918MYJ6_9ALTE|nr:aminopeptidase N [Alteromonas halophila]GGW88504.1 aminopeptidase N [Alteromonas halophila]